MATRWLPTHHDEEMFQIRNSPALKKKNEPKERNKQVFFVVVFFLLASNAVR